MYKSLLVFLSSVILLAACGGGGGGSGSPMGASSGGFVNLDCSTTGSITGDALDFSSKQYVLCLHNKFRSEVALGNVMGDPNMLPKAEDMQALSWDEQLETVAQIWAEGCTETSNPQRTVEYQNLGGTTDVGENNDYLAFATDPMVIGNVQTIFQAWANEAGNWKYGTYPVTGSSDCSTGTCDNATQLFWADTRYVGCAVAHCDPSMSGDTNKSDIYLVCNYSDTGNKANLYPYTKADITDDICSDDRGGTQTECTDGLTHSSNYDDGLDGQAGI